MSKKEVIAPIVEGRSEGRQRRLSFATYFLRDMAAQGRLNEKDLSITLKELGADISVEEVMKVINDTDGMEISDKLADLMEPLASIHTDRN